MIAAVTLLLLCLIFQQVLGLVLLTVWAGDGRLRWWGAAFPPQLRQADPFNEHRDVHAIQRAGGHSCISATTVSVIREIVSFDTEAP
jgi:hypothetical protein